MLNIYITFEVFLLVVHEVLCICEKLLRPKKYAGSLQWGTFSIILMGNLEETAIHGASYCQNSSSSHPGLHCCPS